MWTDLHRGWTIGTTATCDFTCNFSLLQYGEPPPSANLGLLAQYYSCCRMTHCICVAGPISISQPALNDDVPLLHISITRKKCSRTIHLFGVGYHLSLDMGLDISPRCSVLISWTFRPPALSYIQGTNYGCRPARWRDIVSYCHRLTLIVEHSNP